MKKMLLALFVLGTVLATPLLAQAANTCCTGAECCKEESSCCK